MLADNQKHAIIGVVLAAKRLWLAGTSQEQAAGTELLRAIENLDHAMTHPDHPEPVPAPIEEPIANDPAAPAEQPAAPAQPQHVP